MAGIHAIRSVVAAALELGESAQRYNNIVQTVHANTATLELTRRIVDTSSFAAAAASGLEILNDHPPEILAALAACQTAVVNADLIIQELLPVGIDTDLTWVQSLLTRSRGRGMGDKLGEALELLYASASRLVVLARNGR